MSPSQGSQQKLLQNPTPELRSIVIKQTESVLLKFARANLNTQYATKTPLLGEFRNVISAHGSLSDTLLIQDFRRYVPLSDYDAYKPFTAAFDKRHCKEAEVENLFAPGLPYLLAVSSSTSGKAPKIFPKYNPGIPSVLSGEELVAFMLFCGYRELKHVEREPGQTVKMIPVSTASSGVLRGMLGWTNVEDDDNRLSVIPSGLVAPFAASVISHHKSFLTVHALFTLACRNTDRIYLAFSTIFYDLVRYVDEQWDMLLSSIRNGTIPDLPGVSKVHSHLQSRFNANPDRAKELFEIGSPFSCEGWAARIWPQLKMIVFGCSGSFATVLPKVKTIVGPTIAIRQSIYASSESDVGLPYRPDDPNTFILSINNHIEFLDVMTEESHENLRQAWELEVGRKYEVVLTTKDGLWRYRLDDVIEVIGFDATKGLPVFTLFGRRSLALRFATVLISDADIISAVQAVGPDVIQINEFTMVLDDRQGTLTVGYVIEPAGALGPNAHLAALRLSEGLAAANTNFRLAREQDQVPIPTVRILKPGTFADFRQWKAESMNTGPGQVKVPVVLSDDASKNWILDRVVEEL